MALFCPAAHDLLGQLLSLPGAGRPGISELEFEPVTILYGGQWLRKDHRAECHG